MDTIIVALLVGAFSGVFGSIIAPMLSHGLDRKRREELRQEERNRELRHMVEAVMRLARVAHSSTLEIQYTDTLAGDVNQALLRHDQYVLELERIYRYFLWRPHRIHDEALRRLADGLNSAQGQLHILIGVRRGVPIGSIINWSQQVQNVRDWIDRLMKSVDERMDQLGW